MMAHYEIMDDDKARQMHQEYHLLVSRFLEITEYVPLVTNPEAPNYVFPSPRAAEFGVDCGTWFDTLMKELLDDPRLDEVPRIEAIRKGTRNMDVYREVLEKKYAFSEGGWPLRFVGGPEVRPFAAWAVGQNPEWYQHYSRLKHDRFALAKEFTMRHALEMFVALTMIIKHWDINRYYSAEQMSPILEGVIV